MIDLLQASREKAMRALRAGDGVEYERWMKIVRPLSRGLPVTTEEELFYGSRNTSRMHKFTPIPFETGRCIDCGEPESDESHFTADDLGEHAINAREEDR